MQTFTSSPIFRESEECISGHDLEECGPWLNSEELADDLSVADLNSIHNYLGIAGRLRNISPLNYQRAIRRTIIPCEKARLHLCWSDHTIYIKPLPDLLLNAAYVQEHVSKSRETSSLILGFVHSYCALVKSPLDLAIAKQSHLISERVSFAQWHRFRDAVLTRTDTSNINPRYQYGELRIGRLDLIWRVLFRGKGYFTTHREYSAYFTQYFQAFFVVFAFVTTILQSMQVVLATSGGDVSPTLEAVSYFFAVIAMMGVLACLTFVVLLFGILLVYNVTRTILAHRREGGGCLSCLMGTCVLICGTLFSSWAEI